MIMFKENSRKENSSDSISVVACSHGWGRGQGAKGHKETFFSQGIYSTLDCSGCFMVIYNNQNHQLHTKINEFHCVQKLQPMKKRKKN